ncbi:MAG: bifunctional heptose 7-phosphate kinase/heptose 1-phosphate adenyltransferase [Planctomycetes bacterium]|nr:bifunctional heptose 7-phosphate kinase/heptose 1-phosphate adenyltransferase [Planctomycetota bacterium]
MSGDLIRLVEGLGQPRIGVLGDLMLDEYVWGEVERISPEAPIPVLKVSRRQFRVGGAGSVVVNLARLGARVSVLGRLGEDAAGRQIISIFHQEGCDVSGLIVEAGQRTTVKSRHLGCVQQAHRGVQQILRVDDEDLQAASLDQVERILRGVRAQAGRLDAFLVSDYRKGLVSAELIRGVIDAADGVPVFVDPALQEDYSCYRGVDLICPNRFEAELASGISCRTLESCPAAAEKLLRTLDLQAVAMTLDREGILLLEAGAAPVRYPTRARVVADVTGAGDMVLSVLGLVRAAGGNLQQAVELANLAAGLEVAHLGVTPIARSELLQELMFQGHPAGAKVKSAEDLQRIAEEARASGRTLVFTNGCFDLLHLGHHQLLNGARREGDLLIVAVNSDSSIRRLKGPGRPRIPQDDRVRMIAGLQAVDFVVVFDEDTPNRLLAMLRPDVLVKGSEYRTGVVVGREIVEGYGGRVAFVEQIPGISTSSLLEGFPAEG